MAQIDKKELIHIAKTHSGSSDVEVEFSEGTYQGCVAKSYWPFLQIKDSGDVIDGFCSCDQKVCEHLALLYREICGEGQVAPLHVRLRGSFWEQLCQLAFSWSLDSKTRLVKEGTAYRVMSSSGKLLCSIEPRSVQMRLFFKSLFVKRPAPTEENSLKFFHISVQEMQLWKEGRPSREFQYELSPWSDLAKQLLMMADREPGYGLKFTPEDFPNQAAVEFTGCTLSFYIPRVEWEVLIPSLSGVNSPLQVFDFPGYIINQLRYDEDRGVLLVDRTMDEGFAQAASGEVEGEVVGDWKFVPKIGFFAKEPIRLFDEKELGKKEIKHVLNSHPRLLEKYLVGTGFHRTKMSVQYALSMSGSGLHIECHLFEKGDLTSQGSCYFGPWVYVKGRGFYCLDEPLFEGVETVIAPKKMSDFINRHRAWLGGFEGFETHIYQLESHVHFEMTEQGSLKFDSVVDSIGPSDDGALDFGEWVYFEGRGFFPKRLGKGLKGIPPGAVIPKAKIPFFIQIHKKELELLPGFFAESSPLIKSGLEIFLNEKQQVVVRPKFEWQEGVEPQVFGGYTYVKGQGFAPFPAECVLPEKYVQEKVIAKEEMPYFIAYELEQLSTYTLFLANELKRPKQGALKLLDVKKRRLKAGASWLVEAEFQTELGSVSLMTIWRAMHENAKYLFTEAGCLFVQTPRFSWLKSVTKGQWQQEGKVVRLSAIEWFRLCAFEDVEGKKSWQEELSSNLALKLEGFKSDLRSYQEIGVRWLFSLYVQGISGLLCDEMGLGKTHQAMGLMAAVLNSGEPDLKVLVVCPTSVIYHWENLLERFLPGRHVVTFYGMQRSLKLFDESVSILLTSYGTLRSDISELSKIGFTLCVFDELQVAKNSRSQTHKALKKLKTKMRLGLTGTPIENRLLELKALFDLILPSYFPSESQFKELFVSPIEKYQDEEKKKLLSRLIKPFILRRKKSEVLLELPEKIEEISYCPLSEDQKELYYNVCRESKERLISELEDESRPVSYLHVFSLLSQLKQICDHPCLVNKQFSQFDKYRSGKWDLFVSLLQEIRDSGQKVVIFSQYLDMLAIMQRYLDQEGIGYAGIQGTTRDRRGQLEKFQKDPECEVFLASLQAVGVGVDLVSASVVIHYDRWWNPAKENQATDRVHRMGQNRGVQVFKMVTKGTIEEHIHNLIEKKKTLMEGVIGFDEQDQIKGFTRDELLSLMRHLDQDLY